MTDISNLIKIPNHMQNVVDKMIIRGAGDSDLNENELEVMATCRIIINKNEFKKDILDYIKVRSAFFAPSMEEFFQLKKETLSTFNTLEQYINNEYGHFNEHDHSPDETTSSAYAFINNVREMPLDDFLNGTLNVLSLSCAGGLLVFDGEACSLAKSIITEEKIEYFFNNIDPSKTIPLVSSMKMDAKYLEPFLLNKKEWAHWEAVRYYADTKNASAEKLIPAIFKAAEFPTDHISLKDGLDGYVKLGGDPEKLVPLFECTSIVHDVYLVRDAYVRLKGDPLKLLPSLKVHGWFNDEEESVLRYEAASAYRRLKGPIEPLLEMMKSDDGYVREAAVAAYHDEDNWNVLLLLLKDKDYRVRIASVLHYSRSRQADMEKIVELFYDKNDDVRLAAIAAFSNLRKRAPEKLEPLFYDPNPKVRAHAIDLYYLPENAEKLRPFINDEDLCVRHVTTQQYAALTGKTMYEGFMMLSKEDRETLANPYPLYECPVKHYRITPDSFMRF